MPPGIQSLFMGKSSLGISGCRILHSGAPLRCFESRCYYLNNVQNAPSHADVTSISLLTHLKKLCRTTNSLEQTPLLALMLHPARSSLCRVSLRVDAVVLRRIQLSSSVPAALFGQFFSATYSHSAGRRLEMCG